MTSPAISIDQKAAEVISDLATADYDQAQAVLAAEQEKGDGARSTVVAAAEARVAELAPVVEHEGTVLTDGIPDGPWAQLLDGDGNPVLVDGNPVAAEVTP